MKETDLILEIEGKGNLIPPFSVRECHQTLTLLPWGSLRRTLNGKLVSVGVTSIRKYESIITCKDNLPPAFQDLKRGELVKVGCLQALTQKVPQGASEIVLDHIALEAHLYSLSGQLFPLNETMGKSFRVPTEFPGGFMTYRPWLTMLVKSFELQTDEWGQSVSWTLALEEE